MTILLIKNGKTKARLRRKNTVAHHLKMNGYSTGQIYNVLRDINEDDNIEYFINI
ncbi:MAG: hypothetical protein WA945_11445 [Arcobacteraceae bacterium]